MGAQVGHDDQISPEVRWGVGCLVAAASMVGLVILLMYVAFTFDLPVWGNIALGVGLTLGGGLLSWLIVAALSQSRQKAGNAPKSPVTPVPNQPPPGETGAE